LTNTKRLGRYGPPSNNFDSHSSSFNYLSSFYKDISSKPSLLDGKPLFSRSGSSLEKVLAHAKKTADRSRKFLDKIESKKQSSISRSRSVPKSATIRQEYVKCGKTPCYHGKHGPYYYAYWKDPETKKLKKKYIGQYLQSSSEGKSDVMQEITSIGLD
jgi:hypothetical protein